MIVTHTVKAKYWFGSNRCCTNRMPIDHHRWHICFSIRTRTHRKDNNSLSSRTSTLLIIKYSTLSKIFVRGQPWTMSCWYEATSLTEQPNICGNSSHEWNSKNMERKRDENEKREKIRWFGEIGSAFRIKIKNKRKRSENNVTTRVCNGWVSNGVYVFVILIHN